MSNKKLAVIDGETLMDMRLPPTRFCVQTLLPQGMSILGGASKIGKSWLMLDLCVRVAKGETFWGMPTTKGTTLYLCLEDTLRRVQERLNCIIDDVPPNAWFSVCAGTLSDGLCEQIHQFVADHPDTVLVVVDTLQMVRDSENDPSYANDYQEVGRMKKLADELGIALMAVHHIRKQDDKDPLNKLSGTTGIGGVVDAVFILDRSKRSQNSATLICTGRDIEYRELELRFSKEDCVWELTADSMDEPFLLLPKEMSAFIAFMKSVGSFSGSNGELTELFNARSGEAVTAKGLKQQMNKWRYLLEENGVAFRSYRSNGQRLVEVTFSVSGSDESDLSDANPGSGKTCVPCGTCDPDGREAKTV